MNFTFDSFVRGDFDYDPETRQRTSLWLREEKMDVGGGTITTKDIDILKNYPDVDVVTISGLHQDTFEYLIKTYGKQFKAIRFFKNKFVEDWSLLGTLPELEYVHYFFNQRITSLWDMSGNTSLTGLCIEDFSRFTSIEGIGTAPVLKDFRIGNAVWNKMVIDSFTPLANTGIEQLGFYGKAIADNDFSFLTKMPKLKQFNFSGNLLTTEQVAWIVANRPDLEGFALGPKIDCTRRDSATNAEVPAAIIVGKRKPFLVIEGNEERIAKYVDSFEKLKSKYKGVSYSEAFGE